MNQAIQQAMTIRLDYELPEYPAFVPGCRRAPRRESHLTEADKALAIRNALEMIGVLLVPGCEGSAEEAVAKFLVGEKQGDPTLLEIGREEDPDDPMACMHDCAKCSGCGPSELLKSIPVEEVK